MEKIGRQVVQTREKLFISIQMFFSMGGKYRDVGGGEEKEIRVELKQRHRLSLFFSSAVKLTSHSFLSTWHKTIELNGDRESNDGRRVKRL